MKRAAISTVTMFSLLFAAAAPVSAGDWHHQAGYPAPYPQSNQRQDVLKQVVVGGALIGLGFLAGRLTAPQPQYQPQFVPPPVVMHRPTNYGPPAFGGPSPMHMHKVSIHPSHHRGPSSRPMPSPYGYGFR